LFLQDSTDESAAHPRHVRRVLSGQTGSVVSSSTSTSSSSDYEANFTSGNMFNVGATSSQKSFLPTSLQTQQPEEGRPESKRIGKVYNQVIIFKGAHRRFCNLIILYSLYVIFFSIDNATQMLEACF
jgi:hypothetical protein